METSKKGNVLITGSSSGLGFHLADFFVKDGYSVFVNGTSDKKVNNVKKLLNMPGLACDITKEEDCIKLVQNCESTLGNIDTLICNVGSGKSVQAGDESLSEWKRVFDINFFSTVNTINALLKNSKSKNTSIVCISSICGMEYIPGAPITYSVAKSALNTYVNTFSKFLITKGYYLNGIVCGNILFEGSTWDKKIQANKSKDPNNWLKEVPMSKFATPKDIYNAVRFFSNNHSSFSCGSLLVLDGGQTRSS
jgi:3-oxoacyl-[acyl-carrier protein] reductase